MKRSAIPVAMMAAAMMLGASSAAYADDTLFSLVPAEPPLDVGLVCSSVFLTIKNPGLTITWIKAQPWSNGASHNLHDDAIALGFENPAELIKIFWPLNCDIGPQ